MRWISRHPGAFIGAVLATACAAQAGSPNGPSTYKDAEHRDVIRAFVEIERIAYVNPDFLMAKAQHEIAQQNFIYAKRAALSPLFEDQSYQTMQLEVMRLQREMNGLFAAYPRDEFAIQAAGQTILELRSELSRLERERLENDSYYQIARAGMLQTRAKLTEARRQVAIIIKNDPAFRAAVARMRD